MKQFKTILFILFIFFLLVLINKSALAEFTKINSSFSSGEIALTPPRYNESTFESAKNVSIGLNFSFSFFKPKPTQKRFLTNSYLILSENPDNLSFYLLKFVCAKNSNTPFQLFFTYHEFNVFEGTDRAQTIFLSGQQIVFNIISSSLEGTLFHLEFNSICSGEFKDKMSNYSLENPSEQNLFAIDVNKKNVIEIRWNPEEWMSPVEENARKVIDQIDDYFQNHDSQ